LAEVDVEAHSEIGRCRMSSNCRQTVCYKGRIKQSIEFIAAKSLTLRHQLGSSTTISPVCKLDHSKLTHFMNSFQTESRLLIILEYCRGGNLLKPLGREIPFLETFITSLVMISLIFFLIFSKFNFD
jgi:serine/threonine-protein kinase ULK4